MVYSIGVGGDSGLINVTISGKQSMTEKCEALGDIIKLSEKTGIICVLIDCRNDESNMGITEMYSFGEIIAENIRGKLKIAHIYSSLNEHKLLELVSVNRGGNLKHFSDRDKALNWLIND